MATETFTLRALQDIARSNNIPFDYSWGAPQLQKALIDGGVTGIGGGGSSGGSGGRGVDQLVLEDSTGLFVRRTTIDGTGVVTVSDVKLDGTPHIVSGVVRYANAPDDETLLTTIRDNYSSVALASGVSTLSSIGQFGIYNVSPGAKFFVFTVTTSNPVNMQIRAQTGHDGLFFAVESMWNVTLKTTSTNGDAAFTFAQTRRYAVPIGGHTQVLIEVTAHTTGSVVISGTATSESDYPAYRVPPAAAPAIPNPLPTTNLTAPVLTITTSSLVDSAPLDPIRVTGLTAGTHTVEVCLAEGNLSGFNGPIRAYGYSVSDAAKVSPIPLDFYDVSGRLLGRTVDLVAAANSNVVFPFCFKTRGMDTIDLQAAGSITGAIFAVRAQQYVEPLPDTDEVVFPANGYVNSSLTAIAQWVAGREVSLHGYQFVNPNTVPVYVKLFDAPNNTAVTVGATVPKRTYAVPAGGVLYTPRSNTPHYRFKDGIVAAATTAISFTNNTSPALGVYIEVDYV
jgi:hypothetical protein